MAYIGNEPVVSATRTITEITATAGQTTFTANGGYTVGYVDVIINGSQLQTADFTATDGSTIVLGVAASVGDTVRIVAWGTFQTSSALTSLNPSYTGTLTGGTGVVNLGSGQFYKDASGNVGIGTASPLVPLHVVTAGTGTAIGDNVSTTFRSTASGRASTIQLSDGTTSGYVSMAGGSLGFGSGGSVERMRLNNSGTMILQGGNSSATGVGITFPATQVASSDANTLDDYEEGTWTPSLVYGGTITTNTYAGTATYTKIGRQVTLSFGNCAISGTPNNSSAIYIGGLPFTPSGSQFTASFGFCNSTNSVFQGFFIDGSSLAFGARRGDYLIRNNDLTGGSLFFTATLTYTV